MESSPRSHSGAATLEEHEAEGRATTPPVANMPKGPKYLGGLGFRM